MQTIFLLFSDYDHHINSLVIQEIYTNLDILHFSLLFHCSKKLHRNNIFEQNDAF